eukprot:Nitzschia sp. Nitz4//scaffold131_size63436//538//1777//NITZ4_006258-RA/size63436-snap-gene-0.46-mRNA-1//-1//CDS//3329535217//2074//frame0
MEDLDFLENASATYADIEDNGDPTMPLPFDRPTVGRAVRVDAPVFNPVTRDVLKVSNIIYEHHPDGRPPERAYWVGRKVKKCIFGVVKECTILKFRNDPETPWEVTEHKAAGKIMSWQKIRDLQHIEDPQKEVAAMQYISSDGQHPHVMGVLDVLQDEEYLLLFMPYCSSGDLFGFVQQAGRFPEPMARYWFRQILDGLSHLQRKGVCHRDMSLENILVDKYTRSLVIDLGMCLRVPYDNGSGMVSDVSQGGLRRLMKPLVPCGKPNYISPEILSSDSPFDGFAIDLWATGVILFIMLVGLPPWEFARPEDPRYRMISKGKLSRMLDSWKRPVSPLAADLLQKMLTEDPRQRLSLTEVKDHPWVVTDEDGNTSESPYSDGYNEGWRG